MSQAFECDGCQQFRSGPPTYTIERSDGLDVAAEAGEWHVCSWACVGRLAETQNLPHGSRKS